MTATAIQARYLGTRGVRLPRMDYWLLFAAAALAALGLVMVASASVTFADRELGRPFYYAIRQAVYIGAGAFIGSILFRLPLAILAKMAQVLLLLSFLLLSLVLVPAVGVEVNGATRWINVGLFRLQVSEPAKLLFIIYLAAYLARYGCEVRSHISGFLKPLGLLLIAAVLLLLEPDFGATVVLAATVMGMIFMAGVKLTQFAGMLGSGGLLLGGLAVSSPYRMERLTTFMNPWADPFDSGFQLTQSLMAIGRGEWLGVGLGSSVQKLFYLPEAHTDFIFSVIGEELGIIGTLGIILLFGILIWRGFAIASQAKDLYGTHLGIGLTLLVGVQAFTNMGVAIGVLPTKGLTLPFISLGGSSMLITLLCMGVLLNISDHSVRR